jgi:chorismate synthase
VALRFLTAGESHGKALVAIVEGLPAGLPVGAEWVDRDLARRMMGYGRGARMKIERDRVEWLSGIRAGETLGTPVAMLIPNRDWANWEEVMAAEGAPGELRRRRVTRPRPGHADLVGVLKYERQDARDILERASARETTARVAAGALARRLLDEFGVEIGSHVISLGGIQAWPQKSPAHSTKPRTGRKFGFSIQRSRPRSFGGSTRPRRMVTRSEARWKSSPGACPPASAATYTGTGSLTAGWRAHSCQFPR